MGRGLLHLFPRPAELWEVGGDGPYCITPSSKSGKGQRLTASVSWLNKCGHTGFSSQVGAGLEGEGKEEVVKVSDQKPRASRCRVTAAAGGCVFFLSRLKSLAERHSQVCSSFSSQKSSIFWRKSLWAGPGAQVG